MANCGEKTEELRNTESKPAVEVLEPGKNIRPIMAEDQARELVERLFGLQVSRKYEHDIVLCQCT